MNKSQLIEAVASDSGLTKADSARAIESLLGTVAKTLKKGDEVSITGFGKFSVVKRAARQGVNPRTGERVKIKASKAPKFSAGAGSEAGGEPEEEIGEADGARQRAGAPRVRLHGPVAARGALPRGDARRSREQGWLAQARSATWRSTASPASSSCARARRSSRG